MLERGWITIQGTLVSHHPTPGTEEPRLWRGRPSIPGMGAQPLDPRLSQLSPARSEAALRDSRSFYHEPLELTLACPRVPSGGPGCGDTVHPAAALLPHIRQHVDDVPDVDCHRHQPRLAASTRTSGRWTTRSWMDPVAEGLWELMGQQIVDRLNWVSPRCYAYCFFVC